MHTTPPSLLEQVRRPDDQQAWRRFVDLYTPLLFDWARHAGLHEPDAADLVQDVFTLLIRKLPEFQYDGSKGFRRGEWARIAVRHAEDNILDLHAADSKGHDRAADWARNPVISFMVRQGDGTDYTVKVRNARGSGPVTYQLFTN